MIDGYTVLEAASVLGVPEGRVWELLARGVISGTPEGDSMRVYLKARAEPLVAAHEPPRSNGNGGSNGGSEASAFRELLTEFRNLTERYGQALLALGEARGEVAGLRSRVELLESRIDLRLPAEAAPAAVAWTAPGPPDAPPAPTPEPVAALSQEPARERAPRKTAAPRKPKSGSTAPRKAPTRRSAVAGIADALARAEDPSAAELPQSPEQRHAAPLAVEPAPELTPAPEPEAVESTMAIASAYSAEVVEPDWFADGDFVWLDASEVPVSDVAASEATPVEPAEVAPFELPAVEEQIREEPPALVEDLAEVEAQVISEELAEAELQPGPETARFNDDVAEVEPVEPFPVAPVEPPDGQEPIREEPPIVVEDLAEVEAQVISEELAEAELESAPGGYPEPAVAPEPPSEPAPAVLTLSDEELTRLAADEGWGASEVEAIRSLIGSGDPPGPIELPGSAELDAAMEALEATPREVPWRNRRRRLGR